ncbi:MAG: NAD(P)-dependent oxidoreductase, partial [Acetobacteraceae bacterium]|nr:NAD(P)-dependent oxidoreductase [Acetobacteraceae bacterium]
MSETTSDDRDDATPVSARPREGSAAHGRPLGFVGLNGLGLAAALRLATRFPLLGCDEDPARLSLLIDQAQGRGEVHTTPILAELAERCDMVAVLRPTASEAGATIAGLAASVTAGTMLLDLSVSDPSNTRRIAAELSDRSVHLLDASLLGTDAQAEAGRLLILAGGAEAVLKDVRLYLDHLGTVLHVGAIGAGDCLAALLGA